MNFIYNIRHSRVMLIFLTLSVIMSFAIIKQIRYFIFMLQVVHLSASCTSEEIFAIIIVMNNVTSMKIIVQPHIYFIKGPHA